MLTDPDHIAEAREEFERILAFPPEDRAALLERSGASDEIRRVVRGMLAADADSDDFLEQGPVAAIGVAHETPALSGFRLVEVLGSGGMGLVYRAEQLSPARDVAVKVLRGLNTGPDAAARFRLEAELLARLQHPNIARVLTAGVEESDGRPMPFIVMELVSGGDVLSFAEQHELSTEDRVRLAVPIADAMHHAHQRGVIHRDLKPSNILVSSEGEPKIVDFGVARVTEAAATIETPGTMTGQVVGTIRYMSPEQIDGDGAIDVRTDVYALGVVLCELLTGRPPYDVPGSSLAAAAVAISTMPPKNVSKIGGGEAVALRAVVTRALEKDPRDRYQSAAELRDDLERVLDGRPIRARRLPLSVRVKRFAKRRRREVVTGSIVALLVAVFLFGAYLFAAVRPRVAEERWREARIGLVDQRAVDTLWNVVHYDEPYLDGRVTFGWPPALRPADPDRIRGLYETAAALAPMSERLRLERDLIRYAIALCSDLRTPTDPGETLVRVAPAIENYAIQWTSERSPPEIDRDTLERMGDEELRALALFSFIVDDLNTSILACTVYEERVEPDPLIDAITGLIHIVCDRASSAYPRLRRAHEAFPETEPIRLYLADAAIRTGDLARGERYLAGLRETRLLAIARLRVALLLARGRTDEALRLAVPNLSNPFLTDMVLRDIERREGAAAAFQFNLDLYLGRSPSTGLSNRQNVSSLPLTITQARQADAWWRELGRERRAALVREALDYHEANPEDAPYAFVSTDVYDRPIAAVVAYTFGYNWRNIAIRARLPGIVLPEGDGFAPVRPIDEMLALHARWSGEVSSRPEDPGDWTLAQATAYLCEELGVMRFADRLFFDNAQTPDGTRRHPAEMIDPWTGKPADFVLNTRRETRGLWWVGNGTGP